MLNNVCIYPDTFSVTHILHKCIHCNIAQRKGYATELEFSYY